MASITKVCDAACDFAAAQLAAQLGRSLDTVGFDMFTLDMTESHDGLPLHRDNRPAMVKVAGQKASERQLWRLDPVSSARAAELDKAERQARLDALAAKYAEDETFEIECDPMDLVKGLAIRFHETGEGIPDWMQEIAEDM